MQYNAPPLPDKNCGDFMKRGQSGRQKASQTKMDTQYNACYIFDQI